MWDFLSLNGMTVAQLRVIARGMGIPGADDMAKAQLVYGIMDAQEGGTASEDQQPAAPEAAAEEEGNTVATCDWDTLVYAMESEPDFKAMTDLFVARTASILFRFLRKCGSPNWDEFEEEQDGDAVVVTIPGPAVDNFGGFKHPIQFSCTRDRGEMGAIVIQDLLNHDDSYSHKWNRDSFLMEGKWGSFQQCCNWLGGYRHYPEERYMDQGGVKVLNTLGFFGWSVDGTREDALEGMRNTRYVALEWNNLVGGTPEVHGRCLPDLDDRVHLWERAIGETVHLFMQEDSKEWEVPMIMLDLWEREVHLLNHEGTMIHQSQFNWDDPPFFDWHTTLARLWHGE